MVILAVLLTVPVLAKPNEKDEESNLQLHAAKSVINGMYADIYLPEDNSTYHQGDIIKYHFSVQDTWKYVYTRAYFGLLDSAGNVPFYSYTDVIPKNTIKEFTGEIFTNNIPAGKYVFCVYNVCFEDAAGTKVSDIEGQMERPYIEVNIEILPALQPEPTPEPTPTPTPTPEPTPEPISSPDTQREAPSSFKVKAKKNKVSVSWKKVKDTTSMKSIQIECATNPKFTKNVKTVSVNPEKTSATLKLKRKKTYYIRIRYKWSDGVSAWSANKKVRTK